MSAPEKRLLATLEEAHLFATQVEGVFRRPIVPPPEFDRNPRLTAELTADAKARGGTLAELVNAAWQDGFVDVSAPFDEGQRLWVAEEWRFSPSGLVVFRAESMACGHSREGLLFIRYQCALSNGSCREVHGCTRCSACLAAGQALPTDFVREVSRAHLPPPGPWRRNGNMKRRRARSLLEVTGVTVEQNDERWEWAFGWKRVTP